jgi:hypothetical protein
VSKLRVEPVWKSQPLRVVTGRLRGAAPAIQNIPIRTEEGQRIRDAHTQGPAFLGFDGHTAEEEDLHASLAAALFGKR